MNANIIEKLRENTELITFPKNTEIIDDYIPSGNYYVTCDLLSMMSHH